MKTDLANRFLSPRFSLTETFIFAILGVVIGWYATMNFMTNAQQRLLYETSVFVRAHQNTDILMREFDESDRAKLDAVLNNALLIARDQIPEPNSNDSFLKTIVIGPDDEYIDDLRNAIRSAAKN